MKALCNATGKKKKKCPFKCRSTASFHKTQAFKVCLYFMHPRSLSAVQVCISTLEESDNVVLQWEGGIL